MTGSPVKELTKLDYAEDEACGDEKPPNRTIPSQKAQPQATQSVKGDLLPFHGSVPVLLLVPASPDDRRD
jgi:hypothetical protein